LYTFRTFHHDAPTSVTAWSTAPQLDALGMISKSLDACCAKELIGTIKNPNVKIIRRSFFIDE